MKKVISLFLAALIPLAGNPIPSAFANTSSENPKSAKSYDWGKEPEPWDHWLTVQAKLQGNYKLTEYWNSVKQKIAETLVTGTLNLNCYYSDCSKGSYLYTRPGTHAPLYYWGYYTGSSPLPKWYQFKTARIRHYQAMRLPYDLVVQNGQVYVVNASTVKEPFKAPASISYFTYSPPNRVEPYLGSIVNTDLVFVHSPQAGTKPPTYPAPTPRRPRDPDTHPGGQEPNRGTGDQNQLWDELTALFQGPHVKIESAYVEYFINNDNDEKDKADKIQKIREAIKPCQKSPEGTIDADCVAKNSDAQALASDWRGKIKSDLTGLIKDKPNVSDSNWLHDANGDLAKNMATRKVPQKDLLQYFCDTGWIPSATLPSQAPSSNASGSTKDQIEATKQRVNNLNQKFENFQELASRNPEAANADLSVLYNNYANLPDIDRLCLGSKRETPGDTATGPAPAGDSTIHHEVPDVAAVSKCIPTKDKPCDENNAAGSDQLKKDIIGGCFGAAAGGIIGLAVCGPACMVVGAAVFSALTAYGVHQSFK